MTSLLKMVTGLLLASLFFSACNSSLSITKRRYNRGFYVHRATAPQGVADRSNLRHAVKNSEDNRELTSPVLVAQAEVPPSNVANTPQGKISGQQTRSASRQASATAQVAEFIYHPVRSIQSISEKINMEAAGSDALSLVWVIVVILLAAYVAGLLLDNFGMGWVIHLLLVAALVLLILWLLRII